MATVSSKEFLDIQATIKCGFFLKRVRDMIRIYSQLHCTDKYSQNSSIIWQVLLNNWMFVYKLRGCGLGSRSSHFFLFEIYIFLKKCKQKLDFPSKRCQTFLRIYVRIKNPLCKNFEFWFLVTVSWNLGLCSFSCNFF